MKRGRVLSALWPRLVCGIGAVAYLEGVRALAGAPFGVAEALLRWLAVQGVLEVSLQVGEIQWRGRRWRLDAPFGALVALLAGALALYARTAHTLAAWAVVVTFSGLVVALSSAWSERRWALRLPAWGLLAGVGGVVPVLVGQIESSFSEEEFFAAIQAVALSGLVGLLIVARWWISIVPRGERAGARRARRGFSLPWPGIAVGSVLLGILTLGGTVWAYRRSFYSPRASTYAGVSRDAPFVCGSGIPDATRPDGEKVFERLLARVEVNPNREAPEYGMLALATGEDQWAQAFRRAILDDVRNEEYTGPANSVKFGQHLAARRAYYFSQVATTFPELFSPQDVASTTAWLADVNLRAMTVEWVDWMYALAFSYWPEGPYENQENGAGLLALLESLYATDSDLSERNQAYLARNRRGWSARFRNTDDAYVYQPEWIDNALFQSMYWEGNAALAAEAATNRALAFEWLLLQALPDGAPLGYNHPGRASIAGSAYLGATLLDDPRYVWWSARMLDWAERTDAPIFSQPGLERSTSLSGVSPDLGSCLLFGDAGLPTQPGPLAPDKVVFRDGWTPDSRYMLLNLRFSGWHRYKATNTVTLLYQGRPLVVEQDTGSSFPWLPLGRSLYRDKRVPRENLNGLLIPRTGMSAVLHTLAGFGGPWAQDPPHYAEVLAFETGPEVDVSRTVIENWRGWRHERTVRFYHDGPIVVVDRARGPQSERAALSWRLATESTLAGNRVTFAGQAHPAEAVVLTLGEEQGTLEAEVPEHGEEASTLLLYRPKEGGDLQAVTVFLTGEWVGAGVEAGIDVSGKAILNVTLAEGETRSLSVD